MNVVYCLHRSWSLKILEGLLEQQKDRPWKIKAVLSSKGTSLTDGLPVETRQIDPDQIDQEIDWIQSHQPKLILAYGWSWLIPPKLLDLAPCLILHPSKLPQYRGGSPIQNQLLEGVTESAVSIIRATEALDQGNLLAQAPISFEGYLQEIFDRMSETGLQLTQALLDQWVKGPVEGTPQDESQARVVKRRNPAMSEITSEEIQSQSAEYLYNKIRGLQPPYPEAFLVCGDGKKLYLDRAHLEESKP